MGILYDPPLYNAYRSSEMLLYFPPEVKVKSVNQFTYKNIDQYHDGFGFIESTISDKYTINNLKETSVIKFNTTNIIEHNKSKYPHIFSDKFEFLHNNNEKFIEARAELYGVLDYNKKNEYTTFIFSILDIKKRSDIIISHVELLKEEELIGISKVTQDGYNFRINILYNDTLGLKYLLSDKDNIIFKIYLMKPISGKVQINYTYHCFKSETDDLFGYHQTCPSINNNINIHDLMKGTSILKTGN
uniref:Putative BTB_POZ domain-containing protein n=1 Tax=Moumouvirus sp. 'Monve' TaxID=1128131 RepID=H2ECY9_9VIRU|nr:putative BTB_POZ domain-containing protein [Moumouvirus Monve]